MVAIREESGPTMGIILLAQERGDLGNSSPIGIYAPYRATGVGSVDNHIAASPTSAARGLDVGENLRCAARDRNFLQFAVSEKSDVGSVRRQERIACPFSAWQQSRGGR